MHYKSLLTTCLSRAALPLFLYGILFSLEILFAPEAFAGKNGKSLFNDKGSQMIELTHPTLKIFFEIRSSILACYQDFPQFLLMMFCLNLVRKIIMFLRFCIKTLIQALKPSWNKEDISTRAKDWRENLDAKLAQYAVCYTLIFYIIQIIATPLLMTNFSASESPLLPELNSLRLLEEEEGHLQESHEIKSFSLSIGKVLSSINIDPSSIVLSKDNKYAFSMSHYYGILKVIDISNLKSPIVVNSVAMLKSQEARFKYGTLLLSEDGNTLFISNILNFQILNVQDPRFPVLLGNFTDGKAMKNAYDRRYPLLYTTAMVLSKDLKTLFVAGMSLQVFDMSNFTDLKLLSSTTSAEIMISNDIEAINDGQSLLMAEQSLKIYDISDPRNMKLTNSSVPLTGGGLTSSLILSKDKKSAFVVSRQGLNTLYLEKFDISNPDMIKSIHSTVLPVISYENPVILALSPCENYIFLSLQEGSSKDLTLRVYDISQNKTQAGKRSLVSSTSCLLFSSDNRILITATDKSFKIIELFIDFPNKRTFSLSANSIVNFLGETLINTIALSPNQKTLFMAGGNSYNGKGIFEILNVSNQSHPKIMGVFSNKEVSFKNLHYIPGVERVFLQSKYGFTFLDIKNPSFPKFIDEYTLFETDDAFQESIFFTNSSLGLTLQSHMQGSLFNSTIKLLDFTDLGNIKEIWSYSLPFLSEDWLMTLSHDERTLFVLQNEIMVFDLTNLKSIKLNGVYKLSEPGKQQKTISAKLSRDDKLLFVKVEDDSSIFKLKIFHMTSSSAPTFISEITLPLSVNGCTDDIVLSPDSKRVYLAQLESLLTIDISDIFSPAILGIHKSFGLTSDHIDAFTIAEDGKSAYLVNYRGELNIIRLDSPYSLFIKQENFKLGEKYSTDARLLRLNGNGEYLPVSTSEYKPLEVSLLDIQAIETENPTRLTVSSLPYWINFDQENLLLNLEPKSEGDLGTYTICTTFSTKLSREAFNQIMLLSNVTTPEELVITLVGLGYVDNKLFLTSEYGSLGDFLLPQQLQRIREEVHYVLSLYLMETCTEFDITRSLDLKFDSSEKLLVETPSTDYIKVEIKLTGKAKFLSLQDTHVQWLIGDDRSRLTIEGSAKDVNLALKEIIINFEKTGQVSNATVVVDDYLNPPLKRSIDNISKFFINNKEPLVNPQRSVQSQIDSVQISTGQYFTLTLDDESFIDLNNQTLTYQLSMEDNTLPNWLSFNNLVLRGTPPEEIFGREVPLVLTAKNEFKNVTAKFTLRIKISPTYAVKLLIRFSPYILTAIGFWIYANKIYNIFCKRRYKHTKEFYVEVGSREINSEVVFPIALIAEEKLESEVLMECLKEYMKKKTGKSMNNESLVRCFIDGEHQLNKEKLFKALEECVMGPGAQKKPTRFNLYLSEDRFAVTRLIINQMVLWQLNLKEEKSTLACFTKIKEKWSEMVEFVDEKYVINQKMFESFVEGKSSNSGLEVKLLRNQDLNVELLKDALLAHAFENQSLDVSAIKIQISGKQKISENSLRRLFKLDLESIDFSSKGKLGYGINYEINNETLIFMGTAEKRFKGKTMVVQIMNKKQKILKEISIHGVSSASYRGGKSFLDVTGVSSFSNSDSDSEKLKTSYNVL